MKRKNLLALLLALTMLAALMTGCGRVLCCLTAFGELNEGNRLLRNEARERGWLLPLEKLSDLWTGGER